MIPRENYLKHDPVLNNGGTIYVMSFASIIFLRSEAPSEGKQINQGKSEEKPKLV